MEKISQNKKEAKKSERAEIEQLYSGLIDSYHNRTQELRKILRKPGTETDQGAQNLTAFIDQERHELHLKLLDLGKQLEKDKESVLVDILRKDRTLEEYGLPEFSILKDGDIIDTGDWHNPYYFNVEPSEGMLSETLHSDFYKNEGKSLISSDEVMIVFAIMPVVDYGSEAIEPEDYPERQKRARALAEEVGGKVFEEWDTGYHEAYAAILGVVISNKDLEKVAGIIRSNPTKFRLGEGFYPNEPIDKAALLQDINDAIENITGSPEKLEILPESIRGAESLKDKKIIMIDDDGETLETFIPPLLVATNGKASFLVHVGQSVEELSDEITKSGADVVLLDKNLSMGIDGINVAKELLKKGFRGKIIGFSSDIRAGVAFRNAGALGAVNKNIKSSKSVIKNLAEFLE